MVSFLLHCSNTNITIHCRPADSMTALCIVASPTLEQTSHLQFVFYLHTCPLFPCAPPSVGSLSASQQMFQSAEHVLNLEAVGPAAGSWASQAVVVVFLPSFCLCPTPSLPFIPQFHLLCRSSAYESTIKTVKTTNKKIINCFKGQQNSLSHNHRTCLTPIINSGHFLQISHVYTERFVFPIVIFLMR